MPGDGRPVRCRTDPVPGDRQGRPYIYAAGRPLGSPLHLRRYNSLYSNIYAKGRSWIGKIEGEMRTKRPGEAQQRFKRDRRCERIDTGDPGRLWGEVEKYRFILETTGCTVAKSQLYSVSKMKLMLDFQS